MSDLWQWFHDRETEYQANGDRQRLQMAQLHGTAFDLSETDPLAKIEGYRRGRDLAKQLGEAWWVFFYEVWMAIAYEDAEDLQNALTQSLHCVTQSCKPILHDHPWRIAACNTLLSCYVTIDPIGHAPAIRQCLRQLNQEIPAGPNGHRYVMMGNRRKLLMALGRLKQAEALTMKHQALFDGDPRGDEWYLLPCVLDMCWIGYHQNDLAKVQAFADEAEELARSLKNTQLDVAEAQMWKALTARKSGDEKEAKRLFRAASNRADRLAKKPTQEYYDANAYFHACGGDLNQALEVRDKQLVELAATGRFGSECEVHLKRCELLAQLGRLTAHDLERAQEATVPLKNPKPYRAHLKRLASQTCD